MSQGEVVGIFIGPKGARPLGGVAEVRAVAGRGLEGDRYFAGTATYCSGTPDPTQQVTLIEAEALEALARDLGIHIEPHESRRNILTRGVALNHLVGQRFRVGEVVLNGLELCEPCGHLESLTTKGVCAALIHRGGLRAEIVTGGLIRVGDRIESDGHQSVSNEAGGLQSA